MFIKTIESSASHTNLTQLMLPGQLRPLHRSIKWLHSIFSCIEIDFILLNSHADLYRLTDLELVEDSMAPKNHKQLMVIVENRLGAMIGHKQLSCYCMKLKLVYMSRDDLLKTNGDKSEEMYKSFKSAISQFSLINN